MLKNYFYLSSYSVIYLNDASSDTSSKDEVEKKDACFQQDIL